MKGLLVKDLLIVMQRKRMICLALVCSIFISTSMGTSFVLGYMSFLGLMLSLSTLSYDDYDNSTMFFLTLPCTKKQYALEKYVFCFGAAFIFWFIGIIIQFPIGIYKQEAVSITELFFTSLSILPTVGLAGAVILPFQLKFGIEKSRIIIFIMGGLAAVLISCFGIITEKYTEAISVIQLFITSHYILCAAVSLFIIFAMIYISMLISIKIVEKKEF